MEGFADRRLWLGGGALVAVVMVALGWFTLIGPGLASERDLHEQAAATHRQNDGLAKQAASLEAKSAHAATYTASLRTALAGVPYDSGLPAFTRQVNAQARDHQVKLNSVSVGGVTAMDSSTGTGASTTTSTAPGVFSVQVSLQSTGSLKDQLAFLTDVRTTGPRRALVTSVQVSGADGAERASVDTESTLATQVTIFAFPRKPEQVKQLTQLLAGHLDG